MAKPRAKSTSRKAPAGPHALSLSAERRETRAQEAKESPAFESAERRLGIEGKYSKKNASKKRY